MIEVADLAGLRDCRLVERFESFRMTSALAKVSADLEPRGANYSARK